jgi:hypothetical protein
MITDPAALADLPVTVIDVTHVTGADAHGHSTVQTSPLMSELFNGLEDLGPQTFSDAVDLNPLHFIDFAVFGLAPGAVVIGLQATVRGEVFVHRRDTDYQ